MNNASESTNRASTHKASSPNSTLLTITRSFDVPVSRLFSAFATAEALRQWWWPEGLHADRIDYDFREGGHYFISMSGFEHGGGGMTGDFEQIIRDERIVMTDEFADKQGKPIAASQAGLPGNWPSTVYITFEFESDTDASSKLLLSQQGIPNEMQADCVKGWSESFDKLEQFLQVSA